MTQVDTNEREEARGAWATAKSLVSPQMSPALFFMDFLVHPPLILLCIIGGFYWNTSHALWLAIAMVPVGLLTWTLAEYLVHRFVLHEVPGLMDMHKSHHDETLELIGTPTPVSLVILLTVVLAPMAYAIGISLALLWFAGFLIGFIAYTFVHYAVHHFSSGGFAFMKALKWQHNVHHHGTGTFNYGVSSPLWDYVFGTYSAKMRE
jgi:sterol desaturase/sphingolipid hydroxylase (fatty acid hydroxylase superfamily)